MILSNTFIFVDRLSNFRVSMRHLVYGANAKRPEHRAICNVKPRDIVFIYVMEQRSLYGPFVAIQRMFESDEDIGWKLDGRPANWPHRVPLRPWSPKLGVLRGPGLLELFSSLRSSLLTIKDISDLHRRYLNTLLLDEARELLNAFIEQCSWLDPREIISDFGTHPHRGQPVDAATLLRRYSTRSRVPEYLVELFLLQNIGSLEELVGAHISEVYNQVYVYQDRFLDILTIHRYGERIMKATVIEVKAQLSEKALEAAAEELCHYMYSIASILPEARGRTFGVLLTPPTSRRGAVKAFELRLDRVTQLYGLNREKITWVQYNHRRGMEFSIVG